MKTNSKPVNSLSLHLRLRVVGKEKIALGPGKIKLLELIQKTGSISRAAKEMGMSYMKAWSLIQTMKPLVQTARGGDHRGGADLTETGSKALSLYKKMEQDSLEASQKSWTKLQKLLHN